jgi:hypothetical protein
MMTQQEIEGETNFHTPRGIPAWLRLNRFILYRHSPGRSDGTMPHTRSSRPYVILIIIASAFKLTLFLFCATVFLFPLYRPPTEPLGASGGTSATAMVACCIHHVTDVLPILGLSAAASFLTRYQRPFMLVGLIMNLIGIGVMLFVLYRERQKLQLVLLETK